MGYRFGDHEAPNNNIVVSKKKLNGFDGTKRSGARGGGRRRGSPSRGKWSIGVLYAKPPQPRGWWDFEIFEKIENL